MVEKETLGCLMRATASRGGVATLPTRYPVHVPVIQGLERAGVSVRAMAAQLRLEDGSSLIKAMAVAESV